MDIESILGVDPSLSGTGLCLLNPYEKFIVMDRIKFKDPFEKSFKGVFDRVCCVNYSFFHFVDQYVPDIVVLETPLPVGQFAAGGSMVTSILVFELLKRYSSVYTLHPSYLRVVLNKKKYLHSELVALAVDIIRKEEFNLALNKFSADEAVAFILAFRVALCTGYKPLGVYPTFKEKEIIIGRELKWQEIALQRLGNVKM